MRPDPYKRARSRQYQAKHGMLGGNQKPKEADAHKHLPSNITQEQIDALAELDNEPEFDNEEGKKFNMFTIKLFLFIELVSDLSSLTVQAQASIYTCPKNVMDILLKDKPTSCLSTTEMEAMVLSSLSEDLKSFIADYTDENAYIIQNTIIPSVIETKSANKVEISLQNTTTSPSIKSPTTATVRKEKLELEEWLDDVL